MGRGNVLLEAESFEAVTEEEVTKETREKSNTENGVYVKGMALPFGVPSRNGVQYEKQSVKEAHDDLVGRTMLFNHKQDWVTGHILNTEVTEDGMFFEGDINPNAEMPNGVPVAEAIKRGDINSVSIQAFIEQLGEEADEEAVIQDMETEKVAVRDFLEISAVSIPGFPQAEALPEHLQNQGVQPVTEMIGEENLADTEDAEEEQPDDRKGEPFAGYDDFEDCVQDNQDKDDPEAYCGEIKDKAEELDTGKEQTFDDYPEAAVENARMAIEAKEDTGNPNDCGTQVGWERANQLDNGESLSEDTIGRMAAFSRHEDNKEQDDEEGRADCGWMMWNAWGGDEGIRWAENKMDEIDEENLSDEVVELLEKADTMTEEEQDQSDDGSAESDQTQEQVSESNFEEFVASHMEGADVADVTEALSEYNFTGIDQGEVAALLAQEFDLDTGTVMDVLGELEDMEAQDEADDKEDEDDDEMEEQDGSEEETGEDPEETEEEDTGEEKTREELKDKVEELKDKVEELESRIENILDEDTGKSKQSPPSNDEEQGIERSWKDVL